MNRYLILLGRARTDEEGKDQAAPPQGEDKEAFYHRLRHGFESILDDMMAYKIHDAAVVTHGGVIMTLLTAFGYPKRELGSWSVENGKGYTILMSPQMWMRDNSFEIYDTVPSMLEEGDNRWDTRSWAMDLEDLEDLEDEE